MTRMTATSLFTMMFLAGASAAELPAEVDLVLFMGQSNMAGRGNAANSVECPPEAGWEYQGDIDPERIVPISATFGFRERGKDAPFHDYKRKGTMVPSLAKHLYEKTKVPVFGVAASKGGSPSKAWLPGTPYLKGAEDRLLRAREYLKRHQVKVRHCYMLWVQGCSDGDEGVSGEQYKENVTAMFEAMRTNGVETCFVSQIGHQQDRHKTDDVCPVSLQQAQMKKLGAGQIGWHEDYSPVKYPKYETIQQAQMELCRDNPDFVLVSQIAKGFALTPYQQDAWHYSQEGYNLIGRDIALNIAYYLQNGKKPRCRTWEEVDADLDMYRKYVLPRK